MLVAAFLSVPPGSTPRRTSLTLDVRLAEPEAGWAVTGVLIPNPQTAALVVPAAAQVVLDRPPIAPLAASRLDLAADSINERVPALLISPAQTWPCRCRGPGQGTR